MYSMYAVMTIRILIPYFALLSPPRLCIACIVVNIFMVKINAIYWWFPLIGLISFFTIFARYTEVIEGPYTLYRHIHAKYEGLILVCM